MTYRYRNCQLHQKARGVPSNAKSKKSVFTGVFAALEERMVFQSYNFVVNKFFEHKFVKRAVGAQRTYGDRHF
jgi:hypothetical protein